MKKISNESQKVKREAIEENKTERRVNNSVERKSDFVSMVTKAEKQVRINDVISKLDMTGLSTIQLIVGSLWYKQTQLKFSKDTFIFINTDFLCDIVYNVFGVNNKEKYFSKTRKKVF